VSSAKWVVREGIHTLSLGEGKEGKWDMADISVRKEMLSIFTCKGLIPYPSSVQRIRRR